MSVAQNANTGRAVVQRVDLGVVGEQSQARAALRGVLEGGAGLHRANAALCCLCFVIRVAVRAYVSKPVAAGVAHALTAEKRSKCSCVCVSVRLAVEW